jgi:hypothetical protein
MNVIRFIGWGERIMTTQRDPELETTHLQVPRSRRIPALVKTSKYLDRGLRGFSGLYLDHHFACL